MQLSERLTAVAALTQPCNCLADIGTDHGYVPIYLIEQKKIQTAIAMDVNKGPLERADHNIKAHNLGDKVTTRLSDGLHALKPGDADGIVVAGMGGALTIKILEEGKEVAASLDYMVLQPQSEIHLVRQYLYENGYQIEDEDMVFEDGKYYPMMLVRSTGRAKDDNAIDVLGSTETRNALSEETETRAALSEKEKDAERYSITVEEAYYGPILIQKKHKILQNFLNKEEAAVMKIIDALQMNPTEKTTARLSELKEDLARIQKTKEMIL